MLLSLLAAMTWSPTIPRYSTSIPVSMAESPITGLQIEDCDHVSTPPYECRKGFVGRKCKEVMLAIIPSWDTGEHRISCGP